MSEPTLAELLQLSEPAFRAWALKLDRLVQWTALTYAKLYGYPIRKGRIVLRAHTRTHWGQHG